jgi:hypothetical protein
MFVRAKAKWSFIDGPRIRFETTHSLAKQEVDCPPKLPKRARKNKCDDQASLKDGNFVQQDINSLTSAGTATSRGTALGIHR